MACVGQLARRLACGSVDLVGALADAAELGGCSQRTLLLLLGAMTAAGTAAAGKLLAATTPTADQLLQAEPLARSPNTFT